MSTVVANGFYGQAVAALLQWLMTLTACYFGVWLLRENERRSQPRRSERALSRRVRELEREAEMLGAQLQRILDAERFATVRLAEPLRSRV